MPPGEITFVDTNVLVYAHDRSESRRQPIAESLLRDLWASRTGRLSTQVLQEFYVVMTRKLDPPMTRQDTREVIAAYTEWPVIGVDPAMIALASHLEEQHQLSFWDALIVEAAIRAGANRIVTEDLQDGRELGGVRIENPFR